MGRTGSRSQATGSTADPGRGRARRPREAARSRPDPGPSHESDSCALDRHLLRVETLDAKLRPPRPALPLVARRAVLDKLTGASAPLVLMSAPPGAGKTIALLQWVETDPRPSVWVTLDAGDDDPVVLLFGLARGLESIAVLDQTLLDHLLSPAPPIEERILPGIATALNQATPFLLVLDDAHCVSSPRCWDVVMSIVGSLPHGAQIALGTRRDPPIALATMRTRGEVAEVRSGDLAFDREEAAALLGASGGAVDDAAIDAILAATEGWAAGLYLATLTSYGYGASSTAVSKMTGLRGDQREIADYLAAEILERQEREIQDFLLKTSILERVGTAECVVLTRRDDAAETLARLAAENLFVVPLDEAGGMYRYHHLFAEFLRAELMRRAPDEARRLHATVAEWFVQRGDVDQAVHHWLRAGDVDRAAQAVASVWPRMWNRGQLETVRRWLQGFSDEQVLDRPSLTLAAGWVLTALSDVRLGQRWGQAACSARVNDEPSPDGAASLRSSQALLRATLGLDGVTCMREDAELAAGLERQPGTSWYADALSALGVSCWLSGATRRAQKALERAGREGAAYNPSAELAALGTLGIIAADGGDWQTARDFADRAAARLEECGFGTRRRSLPFLLARARLLAHAGDPGLREVETRVAGLLERMVPHPWMTLLAAVILGEALLEYGETLAAQAWSRRAEEQLRRYPDAGILGPRADRLRCAVEAACFSEALTPAEHRVLELLPTHMSDRQIGEQLFVSRNTVKTHLRGVYRKLEVTSRAAAVERARELGLLRRP